MPIFGTPVSPTVPNWRIMPKTNHGNYAIAGD